MELTVLAVTHDLAWWSLTVTEWAGILIGGRVFWGFLKKVWGGMKTVTHISDMISAMYVEFMPNHGTSLKDTVDRLDRNAQINARNIATIYQAVLDIKPRDPAYEPFGLEALIPAPEKNPPNVVVVDKSRWWGKR